MSLDEYLKIAIEKMRGDTMTAKVGGLPSRLGGVFDRLNKAADEAVARLERAEGLNVEAVQQIHEVAAGLEENAKRTKEQLDDLLNRHSNGGPPLDDSSGPEQSSSGPQDGGERPLDAAAAAT